MVNIKTKKATLRKRAQRAQNLKDKKCENCGSDICLERHHIDYKKEDIIILCKQCHVIEHKKLGGFGRPKSKLK